MRPYDQDLELSTIVLGTNGVRSPGVVTLAGHERAKKWDNKEAKGTEGSSSSLLGDPIGTFTATFSLVDDGAEVTSGPSQFDLWDDFQRLIESTTSGPKPTALPIYHPDLARNRFTEIVNAGVGPLLHDGKGGATVAVKFQEYKPPKPKPAAKAQPKPAQTLATTDEGRRSPPDPNAQAKEELAGLLDQAKQP